MTDPTPVDIAGPHSELDRLITELETAAEEHRLGKDVGPTRQQCLVRYAAKALRSQIAETKELREGLAASQMIRGELGRGVERLEAELAEATRQRDAANARLTSAGHKRFLEELGYSAEARAAAPEPPSRNQVRDAINRGWYTAGKTAPNTLDGMTDAVLALLRGEGSR